MALLEQKPSTHGLEYTDDLPDQDRPELRVRKRVGEVVVYGLDCLVPATDVGVVYTFNGGEPTRITPSIMMFSMGPTIGEVDDGTKLTVVTSNFAGSYERPDEPFVIHATQVDPVQTPATLRAVDARNYPRLGHEDLIAQHAIRAEALLAARDVLGLAAVQEFYNSLLTSLPQSASDF